MPKLSIGLAVCLSLFSCWEVNAQENSVAIIKNSLQFMNDQEGIDELGNMLGGKWNRIDALPPSIVVGRNTGNRRSPADQRAIEIGLAGKWIVVSSERDGPFTTAQIGQEPGDIISIAPEELRGPFVAVG